MRAFEAAAYNDEYRGAVFDADDNVIVVGLTRDDDFPYDYRPVILKLDAEGSELWSRIETDVVGELNAVDVWPDGRIVAVGTEGHFDDAEGIDWWIRVYAP